MHMNTQLLEVVKILLAIHFVKFSIICEIGCEFDENSYMFGISLFMHKCDLMSSTIELLNMPNASFSFS